MLSPLKKNTVWYRSGTPAKWVLLAFVGTSLVGALLLLLPISTNGPISPLDAWFTAVSAVCVTGLIVVDTGTKFTPFGQAVVLLLIQLGGLGIMTVSVTVLQLLRKRLSLSEREAVVSSFQQEMRSLEFWHLLRNVCVLTLAFELLGALCMAPVLVARHGILFGLWSSLFHAVSAFCNAGFSLYSDSLCGFRNEVVVPTVVMVLIVCGGLGFVPLTFLLARIRKKEATEVLPLHTRIVLITTAVLIVMGALLFFLVEAHNCLKGMGVGAQIRVSFFQAITPRTAGFNIVPMSGLTASALLLTIVLMFIGGAPGSCAGGIKVSTFAVLIMLFRARIHGQADLNLLGRRIPVAVIAQAITVTLAAVGVILVACFLLCCTQMADVAYNVGRWHLEDLIFEVVSAYGTVGLSTGVTPTLSTIGKLIIIAVMFIGRLGPLTIATAIVAVRPSSVQYPEENVMIG